MSLKVYEARSLIDSMEDRAKEYSSLREKLVLLRKRFLDIVQLDDALKGKGAKAIKGFYQAQIDVVDAWLRLIDRQIAFFKGISGDAGDNDLSGNTVVYQSFLESELSHHEKNYMMMVDSQQDELKRIFNRVDDLVPLNVFSSERFMDAVAEAKKGRNETLQAVENFDEKLKSEYTLSEDDEHYVVALFQQLLEATRQGNEILPIHFNAEQYQSSDVYLLKEQAENQANNYLNFKEEQEKAREQMKRLEEQKQRPWYEKTWEGVKNFTGELTGYYDYIRASEGVDPVTGAELTTAQRVTAGAMAAAGFIPVVGWAGRIVKGGGAIYKTAKGMHAADQALDVYLNAKTFSNLEKAELGIYGLVSVNGFNEYILGKDMFGNELTDLQRQQSLYYSILGPALMATPFIPSLVKNGKVIKEETIGKLHQLTLKTKTGAISFGRELQGGMNVLLQNPRKNLVYSSVGNSPINVMNPKRMLKDIDQGMSKFSFGEISGSTRSVNTANGIEGVGKHVDDVKIPENMKKWDYTPSEELYKKYENVYKNPKYYNQETGEIYWPPNDGFVSGTQKTETLHPGMIIDRYGSPTGSFLAPESDSFPSRALAPHSEQAPYFIYEVIDDFEVTIGKIAPWFDQPGGGTQIIKYKPNGRPYSIEELIELRVIKQINP
ncbi:putative ribonuclease toxin of YeeF-YezG toxin-antitoxin module [Metabacillus crassostreae]|uniref:T7SS effector LXG polymorphic toxin n=1 Tax=Metabacillus crassostreae TaxID=929098 RepID=UPI00195A7ECB|nr:T7SS effector LXG polymorphic toxin [Metabacillus crassostreae]MBM7602805.1 putative ribonuclease toxin of YeeF-YezG toxin-antitoxin module [Metabacillus crassostreae]